MSLDVELVAAGAAQIAFVLLAAPLLQGIIRKVKARLQFRSGPPLLQSYYDLAKLLSRGETRPESATVIMAAAPWVVLGAMLAATLFTPLFAAAAPLGADGGLLVVIGLFALARAALTLGGLDSGSSFGHMGSSRELAAGAIVEPALLLSLAALAVSSGTTQLAAIAESGVDRGIRFIDLPWGLALAAFAVVVIAETGRIPVDNPDTHLELTMIHEAMLLEYSGRSLGALHLAMMAKQLLLGSLLANLFTPFGLSVDPSLASWATGVPLLVGKLAAIGVGLAFIETGFAKMRFYELPELIGSAALAGFLAMAVAVWQL